MHTHVCTRFVCNYCHFIFSQLLQFKVVHNSTKLTDVTLVFCSQTQVHLMNIGGTAKIQTLSFHVVAVTFIDRPEL